MIVTKSPYKAVCNLGTFLGMTPPPHTHTQQYPVFYFKKSKKEKKKKIGGKREKSGELDLLRKQKNRFHPSYKIWRSTFRKKKHLLPLFKDFLGSLGTFFMGSIHFNFLWVEDQKKFVGSVGPSLTLDFSVPGIFCGT